MLETERSSDEALRQPTFKRLYKGAFEIQNRERRLRACLIILLAGRVGMRTGEIQHFCEEWIDWEKGSIAIPQHHPCGCSNCWLRANQQAARDEDAARERVREVVEKYIAPDSDREVDEIVEDLLHDDEDVYEAVEAETNGGDGDGSDDENDGGVDTRSAEEILYEERWQPKYPRSARRVPFGHSRRLTAVIIEFIRRQDHLDITQEAMRNHVTEAAEHAERVDADAITIRGLRATAATHYATYIRNPKVLQDLMGWNRIETASRYLRRSGATSTDIIYAAFKQSDLRPAMFPREPEAKFPIIDNPLPYQKEPYDPMQFHKGHRIKFGEKRPHDDDNRRLIHPRSENYPDDLDYDPMEHEILTKEEYEDNIVERTSTALLKDTETVQDTFEPHDDVKESEVESDSSDRQYESKEEWEENNTRQTKLKEITDEGGMYRSKAQDPITALNDWYWGLVDDLGRFLERKVTALVPANTFDFLKITSVRYIIGIIGFIGLLGLLVYGWSEVGLLTVLPTFPYVRLNISWITANPGMALFAVFFTAYVIDKMRQSESMHEVFR